MIKNQHTSSVNSTSQFLIPKIFVLSPRSLVMSWASLILSLRLIWITPTWAASCTKYCWHWRDSSTASEKRAPIITSPLARFYQNLRYWQIPKLKNAANSLIHKQKTWKMSPFAQHLSRESKLSQLRRSSYDNLRWPDTSLAAACRTMFKLCTSPNRFGHQVWKQNSSRERIIKSYCIEERVGTSEWTSSFVRVSFVR